jgi:replicative DNA helicase
MMREERSTLEREIVGSIFYHPSLYPAVRRALSPDLFADGLCRKIVASIRQCAESDVEINRMNAAMLGKFSPEEISQILGIPDGTGDLEILSKRLAEEWMLSRYLLLREKIREDADAFEVMREVQAAEAECAELIARHRRPAKEDLLSEYLAYLEANRKQGMRRIPTGIPTLDRMLMGGLTPGDLSMIGGTPGSGKTSLMLQMALQAAKAGTQVGFIEAEMPVNDALSRLEGIDRHQVTTVDRVRLGENLEESREWLSKLWELPLDIVPLYDRTGEALSATLQHVIASGARLVFVDYLQVFTPKGKAEDEYSRIKALSEKLRQAALQSGVHVCVASSLNRSETKSDRLTLNSFYGSSQLGHDSSVAILLEGPQKDVEELMTQQRTVELRVVKNREGVRGSVTLTFHLASQHFEEVEARPDAVGFRERGNGQEHGEDDAF